MFLNPKQGYWKYLILLSSDKFLIVWGGNADMYKVGEVYTYVLKNNIGTVLKAGLGLFAVTDIKDSYVVVCPAVPSSVVDTNRKGIGIEIKHNSEEEKMTFLSDFSIKVYSKDLKQLVAELSPALCDILVERCKYNILLTDEISNIRDEADIVVRDEKTFFSTLKTVKDRALIAGRGRYLETEKNIILKTEEVILDEPYSTLVIPVSIEEDSLGLLRVIFETKKDEKASISVKNVDNVVALHLSNFDNIFGRYSTSPIGIGKINDKELCINIWSSLNDNKTTRIVKYTLYLEK